MDEANTVSSSTSVSENLNEKEESTTDTVDSSSEIEETETPSGIQKLLYNLTGSWIFWVLFFAFVSTYPWIRALNRPNNIEPPKRYGRVPEFSFTNEQNKPFGTKQLQGKVWVTNFIFTSCPSICPEMTKAMLEVRMRTKNLKGLLHLVSFSVDPQRDTPEVLKKFGQEHNYDPVMWSFLTGPSEKIDSVIRKGFKSAVERTARNEDPSLFEIVHGEKFILVDQVGDIRGFYSLRGDDGKIDQAEMSRLMGELSLVVNYY